MTLRHNLHINAGETWQRQFPVTSDDPDSDTIVGLAATAQVRAAPASTVALYEWSATAGNVAVAAGSVTLTVPAAVSAAWTWRRGVWALELADPDTGEVTRLAEGWVYVTPEITR